MKKLILSLLAIPLIIFIYINIITVNNNNYKIKNTNIIKEKLSLNNITTYNYYDYTYTVITEDEVIVVNDKYEIIIRESLDKITIDNCFLIYKNNNLTCEEKEYKNNKIIYKYYNALTSELISSIEIKEGL